MRCTITGLEYTVQYSNNPTDLYPHPSLELGFSAGYNSKAPILQLGSYLSEALKARAIQLHAPLQPDRFPAIWLMENRSKYLSALYYITRTATNGCLDFPSFAISPELCPHVLDNWHQELVIYRADYQYFAPPEQVLKTSQAPLEQDQRSSISIYVEKVREHFILSHTETACRLIDIILFPERAGQHSIKMALELLENFIPFQSPNDWLDHVTIVARLSKAYHRKPRELVNLENVATLLEHSVTTEEAPTKEINPILAARKAALAAKLRKDK